MADDIDDLLNEVENTYLKERKPDPTRTASKSAPKIDSDRHSDSVSRINNSKPKHVKDDLNSMIDDIFDDDGVDMVDIKPRKSSLSNSPGLSSNSVSLSSTVGTKKCFPVYLGGSSCTQGLATAVQKRCCNQMRCTDCDFSVSTFEDYHWDSSVDYLFLRNNMPDFHRLKSKLTPQKGSRAYACQCSWKSLKEQTDLQAMPDLKWFCAKH